MPLTTKDRPLRTSFVTAFVLSAVTAATAHATPVTYIFDTSTWLPGTTQYVSLPAIDPDVFTITNAYASVYMAYEGDATFTNYSPLSQSATARVFLISSFLGHIIDGAGAYAGEVFLDPFETETRHFGTLQSFAFDPTTPVNRTLFYSDAPTVSLPFQIREFGLIPSSQWFTGFSNGRVTSAQVTLSIDTVALVPEPASFLLLGTGLAALGYRRWRR